MKKIFLALFVLILDPFGLFAQRGGEVFLKLNQLNEYKTQFKSEDLEYQQKFKGSIDYLLGYNHFLKNGSYLGMGIAYIPFSYSFTAISTDNSNENKSVTTVENTRYRIGLQVGKRNEYKRFKFYSELGTYAILIRDYQIRRDITNTDLNGVVSYSVNEIENWTNRNNEFAIYLSQGVYYNPLGGFSFGMDVGVHGRLGRKNGTDQNVRETTQFGTTTVLTTTTKHDDTFYYLQLLPSIGIRYNF